MSKLIKDHNLHLIENLPLREGIKKVDSWGRRSYRYLHIEGLPAYTLLSRICGKYIGKHVNDFYSHISKYSKLKEYYDLEYNPLTSKYGRYYINEEGIICYNPKSVYHPKLIYYSIDYKQEAIFERARWGFSCYKGYEQTSGFKIIFQSKTHIWYKLQKEKEKALRKKERAKKLIYKEIEIPWLIHHLKERKNYEHTTI